MSLKYEPASEPGGASCGALLKFLLHYPLQGSAASVVLIDPDLP